MKSIGENIKKSRVGLGLSQAEAAKKLDISTPAFCKIETGQTDLNISRLLQIARAFNVSASQLLGESITVSNPSDELIDLKQVLSEKEEEINKLRKKVIDLYDKLGV